jgi:hypothetical protein
MYVVSDSHPVLPVLYVPEQPVHVLSLTLRRRRLFQPSLLHRLNIEFFATRRSELEFLNNLWGLGTEWE